MFYQVGRDSTAEVIRITRIWKSYQTHLRFISHPRNLTNKWWVFWWVFRWLKWTYGEGQGLDVPNPKDFTQIISTSYKEGWWRRGGSNPLPQRCQRCALPVELRPRIWTVQIVQAISHSYSFRLRNKMILNWLPKIGMYGLTKQWKMASPRGVEPLLPPWKGGVLGR